MNRSLFAFPIVIALAAVAAGVYAARHRTPAVEGPLSEFPEMIDLGPFRERKELTGEIPVRNVGTEPLIVEEISAGCSCLRAERPAAAIAPGETAQVKLRYTFTGGPGQTIDRLVQIRTNEGRGWKRCVVRASLVDYVAPSPFKVNAQLTVGDSLRREIRLTCTNQAESFVVKSASCDIPGFTVRNLTEGNEPAVEFLMEVRCDEFARPGTLNGKIRIETTSVTSKEVTVPVSIVVLPRVTVDPPLLVFQTAEGKASPARVEVKSRIPVRVTAENTTLSIREVAENEEVTAGNEAKEVTWFEVSPPAADAPRSGVIHFAVEGDPSTTSVDVRYVVVRPE